MSLIFFPREDDEETVGLAYSKPLDEIKADTVSSFFKDVAGGKIDLTIIEMNGEEEASDMGDAGMEQGDEEVPEEM